jgi:hypothetical protein
VTGASPGPVEEFQQRPAGRRRGSPATPARALLGSLSGRTPVGDAVVVLGGLLVLGVVCGVLWWLLVDPAEFTKVRAGGTMWEVELGRRFVAVGWFAVLALVVGALGGALLTWWRDRDELFTVGLLVLGSALAAAVMAVVGHLLGPPDPSTVLAAAAAGARVPVDLTVTGWPTYLCWPVGVLVGSLMVLWSAPRRRPQGRPAAHASVR